MRHSVPFLCFRALALISSVAVPAAVFALMGYLFWRALPVLGAIMQSGQGAVRQEKRALLGALKPFVTPEVAGQFDHALRLVSMALMARAAMGQLGRLGQADGPSALTAQKEDDSYV